jgi:hypothetical protein
VRSPRRFAVVVCAAALLAPACLRTSAYAPDCGKEEGIFVLMAQAVPTATQLPCIRLLPERWRYSGFQIQNGIARFWLDYDTNVHSLQIDLTQTCSTAGAQPVEPGPDESGSRVLVAAGAPGAPPVARFIEFTGGCITYRYHLPSGSVPTLADEVDAALGFVQRTEVTKVLDRESGLTLCGAGEPPCPG